MYLSLEKLGCTEIILFFKFQLRSLILSLLKLTQVKIFSSLDIFLGDLKYFIVTPQAAPFFHIAFAQGRDLHGA